MYCSGDTGYVIVCMLITNSYGDAYRTTAGCDRAATVTVTVTVTVAAIVTVTVTVTVQLATIEHYYWTYRAKLPRQYTNRDSALLLI